jgi:hypothetical protein
MASSQPFSRGELIGHALSQQDVPVDVALSDLFYDGFMKDMCICQSFIWENGVVHKSRNGVCYAGCDKCGGISPLQFDRRVGEMIPMSNLEVARIMQDEDEDEDEEEEEEEEEEDEDGV